MVEPRDLPLFAWGDALRAARETRRRRARRIAIAAAGIACVLATIVQPPAPRLVWNASASAPIGLYAVVPGAQLVRGDTVIAWPPRGVRHLAAGRRYLPLNVPLVKRVAAIPRDRICAIGARIFVDGRAVAERRARDAAGRPMPWWRGCATLKDGAVLLLMDAPASFDGRYFGATQAADVVGKATLLWARPRKGRAT